jgi:hypothetical protein
VERFISDLKQVEEQGRKKQGGASATIAPRWVPPPPGVIKINVDAAVGKNSGCGTVAAVARSDGGAFLGASTRIFPGRTEAETLEALACREEIALAKDIDARRVRIAIDCKNVIKIIAEGTMGVYAHIVWEIRGTRSEFVELEFSHESHRSNKEAHSLARSLVYESQGRTIWPLNPPEKICIPLFMEV